MILAAIAVVLLIIAISVIVSLKTEGKIPEGDSDRVECPGLTEGNCTKFKCQYHKVKVGPSCYMKKDSFGYRVEEVVEEDDGPLIRLQSISNDTPYGPSLKKVIFKLTYITENILRFQFKDANQKRYEVPVQEEFPLLMNPPSVTKDSVLYNITYTNLTKDVFHFMVMRDDGTELWDTTLGALLLSDKYLQVGSYLPSDNIYGLGEQLHDTLKHNMYYVTWPMFARDRPPKVPADQKNLYSVHPFYTCLEKSGKSHGVFFLNSNAMSATLLPAPAITFRTIGGILDFFIFIGNDPEHVVQLYTSLVGRPMVPPYWSLGFQLSRYGYKQIKNVKRILSEMQKAKIPLAVQYLDIDHMRNSMDFTYDNVSFPSLPEYISTTKNETGLKWVVILDPAIAAVPDYEPYANGLAQNVFVRRSPKWSPSMFPKNLQKPNITFGKVWPPDYVAFPDFFQNETRKWWKDEILKYHGEIDFDGLWIDMNEPANFGTNIASPQYCMNIHDTCWSLMCPTGEYDDPPYNLLQENSPRLSKKTICMESVQGSNDAEFLHYDVHSLYGWSQTQPTLEAAQEATGTRSLVISRSTYPSSGRYAGHWLGDNHSIDDDMHRSIIGILEFNLFGIPYVGADVCGFFGDTSEALCKRWMQLGAFYPFFRNHNNIEQRPQEPIALGQDVAEASGRAIERRICLNPYLYTLFYRAHVNGSTVVRPVFHEFPTDEKTWNMDTQFMWGKSLMIAPILHGKRKSVTVYFPKAEWWRFRNDTSQKVAFTQRYMIETDADDYTPLFVRGGTILPYGKYDWNNYPESSNSTRNVTLYVFPENDEASGELFVDDGISKDTIENEAYALYDFQYANCTLTVTSQEYSEFTGPQTILEKLVVFKVMSIGQVSENYTFTMGKKHSAIITVDEEMKNVEAINWQGSEGNCDMME